MIGYVSTFERSAVVNVAVKWVLSIYVVALGEPLKRTVESARKSIPVILITVSVVPATIVVGVSEVISGVTINPNF